MTHNPASREATPSTPVLPTRYVVVVDETGPGGALHWALSWAALRSVPIELAGAPDTLTFSPTFLSSIEHRLLEARRTHPEVEITSAPGGTCELRPGDLLVIGVGDGGPDDTTRSRAARLAGLAPCSALIVPPPHLPAGTGIVAAIGAPDRGQPIARMAAAEAEMRDEALTLLHVEGIDDKDDGGMAPLAELVAREYPDVSCLDQVARGPLIENLATHTRDASLTVIGPERVTGPDTILGRMIRLTPTPLLVARPAYEPD